MLLDIAGFGSSAVCSLPSFQVEVHFWVRPLEFMVFKILGKYPHPWSGVPTSISCVLFCLGSPSDIRRFPSCAEATVINSTQLWIADSAAVQLDPLQERGQAAQAPAQGSLVLRLSLRLSATFLGSHAVPWRAHTTAEADEPASMQVTLSVLCFV